MTGGAAECSAEKTSELYCPDQPISGEPDTVVFVNESSVDCRTPCRGHAYTIRGRAVQRKAFFVRGKRCVMAAVSPWIV